jgi:hypothetical protein
MKTIQHLDMSSIMEAYTAKVNAEHARAQAIREGRLPKPQPSERWNISDRD